MSCEQFSHLPPTYNTLYDPAWYWYRLQITPRRDEFHFENTTRPSENILNKWYLLSLKRHIPYILFVCVSLFC
jgi:hypothetical protein